MALVLGLALALVLLTKQFYQTNEGREWRMKLADLKTDGSTEANALAATHPCGHHQEAQAFVGQLRVPMAGCIYRRGRVT